MRREQINQQLACVLPGSHPDSLGGSRGVDTAFAARGKDWMPHPLCWRITTCVHAVRRRLPQAWLLYGETKNLSRRGLSQAALVRTVRMSQPLVATLDAGEHERWTSHTLPSAQRRVTDHYHADRNRADSEGGMDAPIVAAAQWQ